MSPVVAAEPIPLQMDADGVFRVGGTRVTLDTVIAAFHEGASPETIAEQYPALQLDAVYAVLTYYLRHRAEVDVYLAERTRQAAEVRAEMEARWPSAGLRARLLARRRAQG